MRCVPRLKSFNLIDFMNLGVIRGRFGYGGSGSGEYLGLFFGRPDGYGSSNVAQNVSLLMLHRSIWVAGADFIKNMDLLAEEGSNFDEFSSEKSAEISIFSP